MKKTNVILLLLVFMLTTVSAANSFSNVSIVYNDSWRFGEKNYVYISPTDYNGTLVDVKNIQLHISGKNLIYEESPVFRKDVGQYYKWFLINRTIDEIELTMNVSVQDSGNIFTNSYNITVVDKKNFLQTTKQYFINAYEKFDIKNFFAKHWLKVIIGVFLTLSFIVLVEIFKRKKK